jgi:putative exosortase-associated protein (TIGR04073 family)
MLARVALPAHGICVKRLKMWFCIHGLKGVDMRIIAVILPCLLLCLFTAPLFAQETEHPEATVEKMAFKLVRGVTNFTTSIAEIPKQSYLTIRDRGNIGYVVGPIKGVGMALYRALIGTVETVFFMVPQPGYYDPMIDPEYVWNGWEVKRSEVRKVREAEPEMKKGE